MMMMLYILSCNVCIIANPFSFQLLVCKAYKSKKLPRYENDAINLSFTGKLFSFCFLLDIETAIEHIF